MRVWGVWGIYSHTEFTLVLTEGISVYTCFNLVLRNIKQLLFTLMHCDQNVLRTTSCEKSVFEQTVANKKPIACRHTDIESLEGSAMIKH